MSTARAAPSINQYGAASKISPLRAGTNGPNPPSERGFDPACSVASPPPDRVWPGGSQSIHARLSAGASRIRTFGPLAPYSYFKLMGSDPYDWPAPRLYHLLTALVVPRPVDS